MKVSMAVIIGRVAVTSDRTTIEIKQDCPFYMVIDRGTRIHKEVYKLKFTTKTGLTCKKV